MEKPIKCINCKNIDLQANKIGSNAGFAYCKHFCESSASGMSLSFPRKCENFELADGAELISRKAWMDKRELNYKNRI